MSQIVDIGGARSGPVYIEPRSRLLRDGATRSAAQQQRIRAPPPPLHAAARRCTHTAAASRRLTPQNLTPQPQQPQSTPAAAAIVPAAAAASTSGSGSDSDSGAKPSGGGGGSALGVLKAAAPVDRLRYQALLLFDHFDADKDGRLSPQELAAFFSYCGRKLMWSPALTELLAASEAAARARLGGGANGGCARDEFVSIVRDQVHAVSCSGAYQKNDMRADAAARLQAQMGISLQEIMAAKWVFVLLDYDADGKVRLEDLRAAAGIESYYVEAQLEVSHAPPPT